MVPNQEVIFDEQRQQLEYLEQVNVSHSLDWTKNELVFRQQPFAQVCGDLEHKYGIDILIKRPELMTIEVNASFDSDKSVDEIINSFAQILDIQYSIKDSILIIQ